MPFNIVQFADTSLVEKYAKLFSDIEIIVARDFTAKEIEYFSAQKPQKAKLFTCKVFSKKDSSAVQGFRRQSDFLAVSGNSIDLCSWAANTKGIDLLLQPFSSEKCFLDMQTANVLRDNGVYVCFLFSEFLESNGFRLSQLLKNAAMCAKLCESAGTKMLFVSGAKNEFHLRASKDLSAFAVLLGLKKEKAIACVWSNTKEFMERSK